MNRSTVSLTMIVRNEAHQLADCLAPVAGMFDEVAIVDTGSTDATREVARQFTPHVFDFAWCDDFAAARNESLRRAHGDWIFWLDADDRLTPQNAGKLGQLLTGLRDRPGAYLMDTVCTDHAGSELARLVPHLRLFHRHPALAWRRRIHERLHPAPESLGFELLVSDVQIEHVGYHDVSVVREKLERNLRLLAAEQAIDPNNQDLLLELGVGYTRAGQAPEARKYFDRLLATAPQAAVPTQRLFAALAELAALEGHDQQAVDITARGLVFFPHDEYLAYLQAEALYQLREYEAARLVLMRLLQQAPQPRDYRFSTLHEIQRRLAPLALSEILRVQRSFAAAESVLRPVVDQFPDDPIGWQFLGRVYADRGDQENFNRVLHRLALCPRGQLFVPLLEAWRQLALNSVAEAQRSIGAAIAQSPEMPLAHLLRAECLARAGAPAAEQRRAFERVLALQPTNRRALEMVRKLTAADGVA